MKPDLSIRVLESQELACPDCNSVLRLRVSGTHYRDVRYNPEIGRVRLVPRPRPVTTGPDETRILVCNCGFTTNPSIEVVHLIPYKSQPSAGEGP